MTSLVSRLPWRLARALASQTAFSSRVAHSRKSYFIAARSFCSAEPGKAEEQSENDDGPSLFEDDWKHHDIPEETFKIDWENTSLIKPMWRERETVEELLWRAKMVMELLISLYKSNHLNCEIHGVKRMKMPPFELFKAICRLGLGVEDADQVRRLYSYLSVNRDILFIGCPSMETKMRFLRAKNNIDRITDRNTGRRLRMFLHRMDTLHLNNMPVHLSSPSGKELFDYDREFIFRDTKRFDRLSGVRAVQAWVKWAEKMIMKYNWNYHAKEVHFDLSGSRASYVDLAHKERIEIGNQLIDSITEDGIFKEDLSKVAISTPSVVYSDSRSANPHQALVFRFRRNWEAESFQAAVEAVGSLPDPLNPGFSLDVRPRSVLARRFEDFKTSSKDNSFDGLVKRLNLVEAGVRAAEYEHYLRIFHYDGNGTEEAQKELRELAESAGPEEKNRFAKNILREMLDLDEEFANGLCLEAQTKIATTDNKENLMLEMTLFKLWEARSLLPKLQVLLKNQGSPVGLRPADYPLRRAVNLATMVVAKYLKQERGLEPKVLRQRPVAFIITEGKDGTPDCRLFNQFGLSREEFERHLD